MRRVLCVSGVLSAAAAVLCAAAAGCSSGSSPSGGTGDGGGAHDGTTGADAADGAATDTSAADTSAGETSTKDGASADAGLDATDATTPPDAPPGDASDAAPQDAADAAPQDSAAQDSAPQDAAPDGPPRCLDWPAWPVPNSQPGAPHAQSYVYTPDGGTVTDQVTGLVWQRDFSAQLHDTNADAGTTAEWPAATAYCAGLALEGKKWRLPSSVELLSIADDTKPAPAIDTSAFPGTQPAYYLASSPHGVPGLYSLVSFDYGYVQADVIFSSRVDYARCVVDTGVTCSDSPARFTAQSGVVVDGRTGLSWQQGDDPAKETFASAATYCSSLVLGTGTWRVPTYREFMSLVDPRITGFDPVAFPATGGTYWMADPFVGQAGTAWHASSDGESNGSLTSAQLAVKCVK